MKKVLKQIFQDIDGTLSSKRVFTLLAILILLASWVLDVFFQMTASEHIFDGFLYVVAVGILGISAEKFVRWRGKEQNEISDTFEEI